MKIIPCTLAILVLASPASASLCVSPGGGGGCFSSVQAAVDAAFLDIENSTAGAERGGGILCEKARMRIGRV